MLVGGHVARNVRLLRRTATRIRGQRGQQLAVKKHEPAALLHRNKRRASTPQQHRRANLHTRTIRPQVRPTLETFAFRRLDPGIRRGKIDLASVSSDRRRDFEQDGVVARRAGILHLPRVVAGHRKPDVMVFEWGNILGVRRTASGQGRRHQRNRRGDSQWRLRTVSQPATQADPRNAWPCRARRSRICMAVRLLLC